MTCRSKIAKIVLIGNPRWPPWPPSCESLFFASSPEPKGHLTPNLLGSIGVTCRSKIAKIVPIRNPRWPPWQPSWKSFFCFFSWTERPVDSKLARKHGGCHGSHLEDLFLAHLSWKLKMSFCDHSPSVVVVVVIRMSVHPSTIFKQHLLLNHWLDFDQTSQEWSLVGPLSKLFKWFRSVAYLGHRS